MEEEAETQRCERDSDLQVICVSVCAYCGECTLVKCVCVGVRASEIVCFIYLSALVKVYAPVLAGITCA